jgi:thioredoxin-related protein
MKKTIFSLVASAFALYAGAATSTPEGFTDDLDAAIVASKASGKTVYAVFSGSDWCYWCKVLEEGYLSKKDFVKEASKKLELVFIDFPRDKSLLSEKAQKNNPALVKKYAIREFPTVMFISSDGSGEKAPRPAKDMSPKDYAKQLAKEAQSFAKKNKSAVEKK